MCQTWYSALGYNSRQYRKVCGPVDNSSKDRRKFGLLERCPDFDNSQMAHSSLPYSKKSPGQMAFIGLMVEIILYSQIDIGLGILITKLLKFHDALIFNVMLWNLFPSLCMWWKRGYLEFTGNHFVASWHYCDILFWITMEIWNTEWTLLQNNTQKCS